MCGVFVDQNPDGVAKIVQTADLDLIQLHGNESPEDCRQLAAATGLPLIKALTADKVRHVVLDEADKMLSLGFADQLERIHRIQTKAVRPEQQLIVRNVGSGNILFALDFVIPAQRHRALGIFTKLQAVMAVFGVYHHAALGADKANNGVTRDRVAAAGEVDTKTLGTANR